MSVADEIIEQLSSVADEIIEQLSTVAEEEGLEAGELARQLIMRYELHHRVEISYGPIGPFDLPIIERMMCSDCRVKWPCPEIRMLSSVANLALFALAPVQPPDIKRNEDPGYVYTSNDANVLESLQNLRGITPLTAHEVAHYLGLQQHTHLWVVRGANNAEICDLCREPWPCTAHRLHGTLAEMAYHAILAGKRWL